MWERPKVLALSAIAPSLSIESHADPGPMPRRARPRWQRFHQLADETVNSLDGFRYGHFVDEFTPPLARIF
jgi:hypothetical protein